MITYIKYNIYVLFFSLSLSQIDTVITINASSYDNWIYFSFAVNDTISILTPEESLDWDIAFKRNNIKTNSGLSGIGNGGGYIDSTQIWTNELWDNIDEISNSLILQTDDVIVGDMINYEGCYDPSFHLFLDCVKNPALDQWGWFDANYHFNISHYILFVKTSTDYIKFWPYSYYTPNGSSGHITFRYQTGINFSSECEGETGDINNDNIINVVDVVALVNYILGNIEFDDCLFYLGDLNQDEIINVVDIIAIIDFIIS